MFLEDSVRGNVSMYCKKLKNTVFLCDSAFLTDISSHLNNLNTKLQGRDQTISDLYAHIGAFQRKLNLFREGLSSHPLLFTHFPACEEMQKNVPQCEKLLHKYATDIERLQEQFKHRFQDFHAMRPWIMLFVDPLWAAVNEQPPELQLELCDLQSDLFFQARMNEKGISFWSLLPQSRFPHLREFALSVTSMFGSTYICESSFSKMKHIKSKERNRLSDDTLLHVIRIGCTKVNIDIHTIVAPAGKATSFKLKETMLKKKKCTAQNKFCICNVMFCCPAAAMLNV